MGWTRTALQGLLVFLSLALISVPAGEPRAFRHPTHPQAFRTLRWAGRTWYVRSGYGPPGPNFWSDDPQSVWVDPEGRLHLRIRRIHGVWYAAELWSAEPTSFGTHRFYVEGPVDRLDPNVVLGLFLYSSVVDGAREELDIEFSTWGISRPGASNGWYTVWRGGDRPVAQYPFSFTLNGSRSTHTLVWEPKIVRFESLQGFAATASSAFPSIGAWTYLSPQVPTSSDLLHLHFNLWLVGGKPPSNGQEVEIVLQALEAPPGPPRDLQASDGRYGDRVRLTWTAAEGASRYRIYRAEQEAGPYRRIDEVTSTWFDDLSAVPGKTFFYAVQGLNPFGGSLLSGMDSGHRAPAPSGSPASTIFLPAIPVP